MTGGAVHWSQVFANLAVFAACTGALATVFFPWRNRRDSKLAAKVVRSDADLRTTIESIFDKARDQIQQETLARIDKSDELTAAAISKLEESVKVLHDNAAAAELEMARQFGGNGGGIREAINTINSNVSNLTGRFDQHLSEVAR